MSPRVRDRSRLEQVERVLRERSERGRTVIPIMGNGVNVQASEHSDGRHIDAWANSLRRLWKEVGVGGNALSRLRGSEQSRWEALRRAWCTSRALTEHWEAELSLNIRLCGELSSYETKSQRSDLYALLLSGGFENLFWFNVDRTLELCACRLGVRKDLGSSSWNYVSDYLTLHADISYPDGTRGRLWYPCGNTLTPEYMRLGMHSHALTIHDLEALRSELMDKWRDGDRLKDPDEFYRFRRRWTRNWVDLFFTAPLIFLGTSLSVDDWPLWWLLHQRARNFTAFTPAKRPKTYVLAAEPDDLSHLKGSPADIEVIKFATHNDLWKFFLAALQ